MSFVYTFMGEVEMPKKDSYEDEFYGEGAARAKRRRRKKPSLIMGLFLMSLLTFFLFACTGYLMANRMFNGGLAGAGKDGQAEAAPAGKEVILLIGVDKRDPDDAIRADTIMLAVLDGKENRVDLLSIPRDSRVQIPGHGYDKINHARAYGGPSLLVDTVNNLLGSRVSKYVELDFNGFEKIIDTLGGIEIDVDRRMYYPDEDIDLQAGFQRLNGHDALSFVRFRNDPEGDITRIGRQQVFVKALIDQTLRLATLPKIPKLVSEVSRHVTTNLTVKEMLSLALSMKDLDMENVHSYTVPGEGRYINNISYWVIDHQKMADIIAVLPDLN